MNALTRPIIIFIDDGVRSGQMTLVFSGNYILQWVIYAIVGVLIYVMTSRMTFQHMLGQQTSIGFASSAAIVTGLFFATCVFYPCFAFTQAARAAWHAQVFLSLLWFLVFIFVAVSAPAAR